MAFPTFSYSPTNSQRQAFEDYFAEIIVPPGVETQKIIEGLTYPLDAQNFLNIKFPHLLEIWEVQENYFYKREKSKFNHNSTIWPFKSSNHPISYSSFSTRIRHGGKFDKHEGIDFLAKEGEKVVAISPGKIVKKFQYLIDGKSGLGSYLVLRLDMPNSESNEVHEVVYAHLDSIYVNEGDHVNKGDLIGNIGMTGKTSIPHLHFEYHKYQAKNEEVNFSNENAYSPYSVLPDFDLNYRIGLVRKTGQPYILIASEPYGLDIAKVELTDQAGTKKILDFSTLVDIHNTETRKDFGIISGQKIYPGFYARSVLIESTAQPIKSIKIFHINGAIKAINFGI